MTSSGAALAGARTAEELQIAVDRAVKERAEESRIAVPERPERSDQSDKKPAERAYFIDGGSLHLTCRDRGGLYFFVKWIAPGYPWYTERAGGYVPRKVPMRDGAPVDVVGVPEREAIDEAPATTAAELYKRIEAHITKYIDAPPLDRELFIYYALFTWYAPKVNTAPYLRFLADTGNGKSRMQRVIGDLCFYPIRAGGSSTPAGIMRLKERWNGTLLIDEADLRSSDATNELIKYLNLGFEKGQYFIKGDKENPREQDILDPFGPKIIGMRQPFQDNATEGRCLSFAPKETTRTDIPFVLPASYDNEVRELRGIIARFVLSNYDAVDGEKTLDVHDLLIEPRLKQMAIPISIVLQIFPDGSGRFRDYLTARQQELKQVRAASYEGMVFNSVLDWAEKNTGFVTASGIYEQCGLKSANAASRVLHSLGFKTEVTRTDKIVRALVIPDERTWTNVVQRYYFSDTGDKPECPDQLKSKEWAAQKAQKTIA